MVALNLVVRPAVRRPKIDVLVAPVALNAKSHGNQLAFAAPGAAVTWTALRPLKFVRAIETFFPANRSVLWAKSGRAASANRSAQITVIAERERGFI